MQETHQILSDAPRVGESYDPTTAVLYGQFIAAAYAMYDAQPTNSSTAAAIFEFPARI